MVSDNMSLVLKNTSWGVSWEFPKDLFNFVSFAKSHLCDLGILGILLYVS